MAEEFLPEQKMRVLQKSEIIQELLRESLFLVKYAPKYQTLNRYNTTYFANLEHCRQSPIIRRERQDCW